MMLRDTVPVFDFFKGDQIGIFETAVKNLEFFGNSKTYVSNQELLKVVEAYADSQISDLTQAVSESCQTDSCHLRLQ